MFLGEENVTHLPQHLRVKRGMTRTFQINTLFPGLTTLESVVLAVCECKGVAGRWRDTVAQRHAEIDAAMQILKSLQLERDADSRKKTSYGKQRLVEIALAGKRSENLVDGRAGSRYPVGGEQGIVHCAGAAAARSHHPIYRARHGAGDALCGAHYRSRRRRVLVEERRKRLPGTSGSRKSPRRSAIWLSCSARQLTAGYGESIVLEDISLRMQEGDSLALLGRNGVGNDSASHSDGLHAVASRTSALARQRYLLPCPITGARKRAGWVPQERFMFPLQRWKNI